MTHFLDTCSVTHLKTEHHSMYDAKEIYRMSEITRPGSILVRFLWGLWRTKWNWDHVFLRVLLFIGRQYYSTNAPHSYFTHLRTLLRKLLQRWFWYNKQREGFVSYSWRVCTEPQQNSIYTHAGYPDRQLPGSAWPSGKFVENSTKLTCLEITVIGSSKVHCYG